MQPILTETIRKGDFLFLGKENVITPDSDFGKIWGDFFDLGGYNPILPYAEDSSPVNVWFYNEQGEFIYMQGLFVRDVTEIPEGYRLRTFPASEYLMVTTEWLDEHEKSVGYEGNGRCNGYADTVAAPQGYERYDEGNVPIHRIEVEVGPVTKGYRYEVWVPIRRQEK